MTRRQSPARPPVFTSALLVGLSLTLLASLGCERRELAQYESCRPSAPACAEGLTCEEIPGSGGTGAICTTACAATVCAENYDRAWLAARGVGDCLGAEFAGECPDTACCLLREAAGRTEPSCTSGSDYRFAGVCAPPSTPSNTDVDAGVADAGPDASVDAGIEGF